MIEESPDSVLPSSVVGLYASLFEHGSTTEVQLLSDAGHPRSQDSRDIIASLRRSCESFHRLNAPRSAAYCSHRMAREYFTAGDFDNAKQLFDGVTGLYRQEGWITLLWETLGYLRECSWRLVSVKDFIQYSLEMATLPVFSSSGVETLDGKRAYGPAGPPTLSQRETIQQEVFSLLKGHASELSSGLIIQDDQPTSLTVDLVNPLRMAFLTSVAFHSQTMKPGLSALITVSILSQLPHPVEIDQLEIQFNQPSCNFKVVNDEEFFTKEVKEENHDTHLKSIPSLILTTNKWLRMTFEISSGQSGKLECVSVNVMVGHLFTFCCRPESPASMEGLALWKFEDLMENFPSKDPIVSFSGQKYIQVEEPEPQVELTLSASSPALVGESFIVPVSVISKGHAIHSAELKINLVDAKGGGMLMSPRDTEPFSLDDHHVELLCVSGAFEDDSQSNSDDIRKIQQSFGVVSVPFLGAGQSWSCRLEIKWNRPKSVMLYVSLGYLPNTETNSQRINVHRSLQIEGKIPFTISHRFMMPFRREALLLPRVTALPDVHRKMRLPLNERTILMVSARNCSEIPLRLVSLSIEPDGNQDPECSCSVQQSGSVSFGPPLIVPGEEFKQVFSVTPQANSPNIEIGTVHLKWVRDSNPGRHSNVVLTKQDLPGVSVETPTLVVSLDCPPHAVLGFPFSFYIKVHNNTSLLQEINYTLGDSQSFVFTGRHTDSVFILPKSEHIISYKLLPLVSGLQHLPIVTVTSVRYSAAMNPSLAATTLFVYPSEPYFDTGRKSELVQAS
ncbi:trafficking protein particle complex subunit 11 [Dendrobium catenatum]|uniref:Trafficking protein particle complex subunit 11 domain-containing protein n=1 Tax=Dendrobium catenatum TaxID=906689 RepID=A0A2I0X0W5_9ASPA|nr:trafficking protein particle complex subunit 11 [Dendrobium catenatum]XP_020673514.1 trafficking protein particle complex subunit 11 [Dendrobium catenatum]XP_020673515.1 trafficking protein particle complex subunit 11 [Dendrobium catenatum]XP_020673516.1 trafficking protein particle complex subunit 11 [Dendrobium catenatum]XP_020673517.1 trafficking protein particle complex subunit 11 [Dendrobium catenatum]XP_020673518.1 trafficking protein particle complex subunit 11 [Dendrobium catenatum]